MLSGWTTLDLRAGWAIWPMALVAGGDTPDPDAFYLTTEGGDVLTTESGDRLTY